MPPSSSTNLPATSSLCGGLNTRWYTSGSGVGGKGRGDVNWTAGAQQSKRHFPDVHTQITLITVRDYAPWRNMWGLTYIPELEVHVYTYYMYVHCLVCLFVCLTLIASFFLPSLIKTCTCMYYVPSCTTTNVSKIIRSCK